MINTESVLGAVQALSFLSYLQFEVLQVEVFFIYYFLADKR